jgi:Virulence factor
VIRVKAKRDNKESEMPDVTIVYWRDIPAQVIVGKGRRGAKAQLPERFEQAIDRAAMKVNAKDADAYLAEWRKADPYSVEGEQEAVAAAEAARLDNEYDQDRIKQLIANDGWA